MRELEIRISIEDLAIALLSTFDLCPRIAEIRKARICFRFLAQRLLLLRLLCHQSIAQQRLMQTAIDLQAVLETQQHLLCDARGLFARLAPLNDAAAELRVAHEIRRDVRV